MSPVIFGLDGEYYYIIFYLIIGNSCPWILFGAFIFEDTPDTAAAASATSTKPSVPARF